MEIISRRMDAQDLHPNLNADYPRVEADQVRQAPRTYMVAPRYPVPPRATPLSVSSHFQPQSQQSFQPFRESFPSQPRHIPRNDPHYHTPSRYMEPQTSTAQARPTLASAQPMISKIDGQMYQLQPIGQVGGGSRSKYEPPYTAARSAPGYVQPSSSRFSSFDRSSAPARRPSDQDVALPSVERETIDLTSPRRIPAYQQPVQNHEAPTRSYDDVHAYKRKVPSFTVDDERLHPERLIKRPMLVHREEAYTRTHKNGVPEFHPNQQTGYYSAPRGAPPEPVIDLTSSPDGRDRPPPRRSAVPAGLRGYAYHPEVPAGEPSRSYMSDTRLYERRAPPAHDNPFQDGRQPFPAPRDDVRYTRNGSRYGG
ncbi:hypothetical protein PtrSN002B_003856 [Pyrenophora tritici-repentis]|nr:hypothetical protein PtrV1_03255 [Pyrenophora tritici-repentis]KAF7442392.1 hypothetical protein A1F99_132610 [Pyrenophora tritici-repentis]KAF7579235.1 hypothetical protein PtrM4_034750 [Pyrenophora tritici-repentis]KAI1547957.1 hypothetical protein PtrSN001A_001395 [Pyrenophora tritici-repentis]KAI1552190.1 hypothetical protein PtrSN001C_000794 [Pyrenophora tritici-repentis]